MCEISASSRFFCKVRYSRTAGHRQRTAVYVSRLKFSKEWDFDHRTSSPRHSQSNGKAESAVKEAKKILVKCKKAGSDAFLALLDHRNTPPAGIQISPPQRLPNRRTLPMSAGLLKPSVANEDTTRTKLRLCQQQQACYYERGTQDLDPLEKGDPQPTLKIMEQYNEPQPREPQDSVSETHELPSQAAAEAPSQGSTVVQPPATPVEAPELRRSQRVRRVPKHLEDYVLA
ncbi:hypothetical protein ACROYT_G019489 [Oculina patagonica]